MTIPRSAAPAAAQPAVTVRFPSWFVLIAIAYAFMLVALVAERIVTPLISWVRQPSEKEIFDAHDEYIDNRHTYFTSLKSGMPNTADNIRQYYINLEMKYAKYWAERGLPVRFAP
jgi:hypothetical protein